MTSDAKEMADNNRSTILNNHSGIRINCSAVHINRSTDKVRWKNVQITAQFSASWPSYDD